ncbi:MAG: HD domain-containing phosphohydrolase [Thermogutta sp.]
MASNKRTILVVDDCEVNREILLELLTDEYHVVAVPSGEEALRILAETAPDIVLLDIMMPGLDGYETCRQIKSGPFGQFTQVILVSGKSQTHERLQGYAAGADDYIVKPFDHEELCAKLRVHLRLKTMGEQVWSLNAQLQKFNDELEQLVQQRTAELVETRDLVIFALAKLAESRDPETGEHLERMRWYSRVIAEEYLASSRGGSIPEDFPEQIFRSAPLHDIGKVGIPDAILLKPGRLTHEEFEAMKRHTIIGYEALKQAREKSKSASFLEIAAEIARSHHERYDGTGYPDGLVGEQIPLSARIVSVADVFDALTSRRVYKPAWPPDTAKALIEREAEKQFDPNLVAAFVRRWREIESFGASYWNTNPSDLVEAVPAIAEAAPAMLTSLPASVL